MTIGVPAEPSGDSVEEDGQPTALRDLARQTASVYVSQFRDELKEFLSDCGGRGAESTGGLPEGVAKFLGGGALPSVDDLVALFGTLKASPGFLPARGAQLISFYLDACIPPLEPSEIATIHALARSADGRGMEATGTAQESAETWDDILALEFARLVGNEHAWRAIKHLYAAASSEPTARPEDDVSLARVAEYRKSAKKPPPLAVGWDAILYYRPTGVVGQRKLQILRAPELKYVAANEAASASAFEFTAEGVTNLADHGVAAAFRKRYGTNTDAFRKMASQIVDLWTRFDRGGADDDPDGCKLRLLSADTSGPELKLLFGRYSHFYYRTVNDSIIHASFDGRFSEGSHVRPFKVEDDAEWADVVAAMAGWRDELMRDWLNFCFTGNEADQPFPRTGSMFTTHQSVEARDGFAFIWQRAPGQDYQANALTFGFEEQAYADRTKPIGRQGDWPILKSSSRDLYKPPSASGPDETVDQTVARGLREELGVRGQHPDHMGRSPRSDGVAPRRRLDTLDPDGNRDSPAEIFPYALAFEVNSANAIVLSHVRLPYPTGILGDLWLERASADGDQQEEGRDLELRRCFTVPLTFHHVLPWVLRDSACRAVRATPTIPGAEDVRAIFGGMPNPGVDPPIHESSAARAFVALVHTYGWDRTLLETHYWARFWDQRNEPIPQRGVRKTLRRALEANLTTASAVVTDGKWPSELRPDRAVAVVEAAHTWYWYEQLARLLAHVGQTVPKLRDKIMVLWAGEPSRLSRQWAYLPQIGPARVPMTHSDNDVDAREFQQRLLFALLSIAQQDLQLHWLEIRLLFEAWRKARLAARELRLLDALGEFAPTVSPFQHAIESDEARHLAESTGWHNLLRIHDTIILYYRLITKADDQFLASIDLANIETSDGTARPPDLAGLSERLVQLLQRPIGHQRDGLYVQVNSFVHPLSDARVRRPRWQLRLVRIDRVDQIRSDVQEMPVFGYELAPRSLDFIRHRSDLTAPSTTPAPFVGPQRLVVRIGGVDRTDPLRLYRPSGQRWLHGEALSTEDGDREAVASLIARGAGYFAKWIVQACSRVFPGEDASVEVLAIGFDAISSDVVLYARCSIDSKGIAPADFESVNRDQVANRLVETVPNTWESADATLFMLHLAASSGYGWGGVHRLVQSGSEALTLRGS